MSMSLKKRVKSWLKLIDPASETRPKLIVTPEVLSFIERTASQSPESETGGILIGHHSGNDILVTKATDAGPNARRSQCGFLRDRAYCQKILEEEFAASGADYLGEWHTHVVDLPRPSSGDIQTLAGIILDPDYDFPSFAMILALVQGKRVELLSYVVTKYSRRSDCGQWMVRIAQTSLRPR